MKIGFIGLGNVGGKLARSLLRKNFDLTVVDLNEKLTKTFEELGAKIVNSPKKLIMDEVVSLLYLLTEYAEFITALLVAIFTNDGDQ